MYVQNDTKNSHALKKKHHILHYFIKGREIESVNWSWKSDKPYLVQEQKRIGEESGFKVTLCSIPNKC